MTTTTSTQHTPTADIRPAGRPLWQRLLMLHLGGQLTVAAWFVGTALVVMAVGLAVISRYVEPSISVVRIAQSIALWFPFGVAIVLVVTYLRTVVAAGGTRRAFTLAGVISAVVMGVVLGPVFTGLLMLEDRIYDSFGWTPSGDAGGQRVLSIGIWPHLWGMTVSVVMFTLAGLLVGATYLRWRGWATLLLPVTVALPITVAALTTQGPRAITSVPADGRMVVDALQGTPLGVALLLITITATAAAAWWVLRRIPIRPSRS
ncbi:hypothetical protein [Ornithinimicrobium sp. Y1694]|uniref:hypothetical protein n=1 Tax=Ornithinimicrobium sp. Y1694 TaxID=3418590 RepID=UPI003CF42CCB